METKDLINALNTGDNIEAGNVFNSLMADRINSVMDDRKVQLGQSMMAGEEVVQLYIRDKVSSVTRNVKDLKGFKRVSLAPGETKIVTLPIRKESLWFYNLDMERVVEPGEFDIMVGNSSQNVKSVTLTVQ